MTPEILPLRTPTLPPATHTNCYLVGDTVIDPGSPDPNEQARLLAYIATRPIPLRRILLTHHHGDHIGGAWALSQSLNLPIYAHSDSRLPFPTQPPPPA